MPIPIFPKNYNQEVVITPIQHLKAEEDEFKNFNVPKSIIFCYEEYIMNHISDYYPIQSRKFWTADIHYFKDTDNKVALVGNFGIGGPASCHLLEILIAAGINNYIMVGHAGGLQKSNPAGTIILCDKAVRDEGVSYHYLKEEEFSYPSKGLSDKVEEELKKAEATFKRGSTWTIDSMYRETLDEVRHYEKKGIDAVEMEVASMFAVADFRAVSMAGMLVISDYVIFQEWEEHLYSEDTTRAIFKSIDVAKKVLEEL